MALFEEDDCFEHGTRAESVIDNLNLNGKLNKSIKLDIMSVYKQFKSTDNRKILKQEMLIYENT